MCPSLESCTLTKPRHQATSTCPSSSLKKRLWIRWRCLCSLLRQSLLWGSSLSNVYSQNHLSLSSSISTKSLASGTSPSSAEQSQVRGVRQTPTEGFSFCLCTFAHFLYCKISHWNVLLFSCLTHFLHRASWMQLFPFPSLLRPGTGCSPTPVLCHLKGVCTSVLGKGSVSSVTDVANHIKL